MTEDEWLSPPHIRCRAMLNWVKRTSRAPFTVQSRRYRLLAVAFARRKQDAETERECELVERYVEGHATQAEFRAAQNVRESNPENRGYLQNVLHHEAYEAAAGWVGFDDAEAAALIRDIFGNPFRPVVFAPEWRTDTAVLLARQMYESRDFSAMPILADALQDAGCDSDDILNHCRKTSDLLREPLTGSPQPPPATHVRGCWVCDLVLGKA